MDLQRQGVFPGKGIRFEMNQDEEYSNSNLAEDLEFLRQNNLIEIVGINNDGEWLYSLTKEAKEKVEANDDSDLWSVLHELITNIETTKPNEE